MARSPDHPELEFIQAKRYATGRPDGPPLWIVVHDMEASEWSGRAESTANYFATLPDGHSVSSHYCVDNDSVVQCVRLADTAYTVGNRPGNYRGINWEFAGFARQTRAEWLDAFGLAMFAQAAPYIRSDAARYKIPLRRCSVSDLKAFRPGVTSHNDLRLAFGGTTHTDPGPAFPWDEFMAIIQGDDMPDVRDIWVGKDADLIQRYDPDGKPITDGNTHMTAGYALGYATRQVDRVLQAQQESAAREEAILQAVQGADAASILAAIAEQGEQTRARLEQLVTELGPAIAAAVVAEVDADLDEDQVAAAVARELAERLAQAS